MSPDGGAAEAKLLSVQVIHPDHLLDAMQGEEDLITIFSRNMLLGCSIHSVK